MNANAVDRGMPFFLNVLHKTVKLRTSKNILDSMLCKKYQSKFPGFCSSPIAHCETSQVRLGNSALEGWRAFNPINNVSLCRGNKQDKLGQLSRLLSNSRPRLFQPLGTELYLNTLHHTPWQSPSPTQCKHSMHLLQAPIQANAQFSGQTLQLSNTCCLRLQLGRCFLSGGSVRFSSGCPCCVWPKVGLARTSGGKMETYGFKEN